MKITKDYLRELIRESLEENKEMSYDEFVSKALDIVNAEKFYSDKMIQLFNTVDRENLKKIVKQAENDNSQEAANFNKMIADMKSLSFIAKKLSDSPQNATSHRYSDESGITVAENKKLSKDTVRQLIRESLEEIRNPKNPMRKKTLDIYGTEGEFDNPNIDPENIPPELDFMNVAGRPEDEYESYSKMHDAFMQMPTVQRMWKKFVDRNKQKIKK